MPKFTVRGEPCPWDEAHICGLTDCKVCPIYVAIYGEQKLFNPFEDINSIHHGGEKWQ